MPKVKVSGHVVDTDGNIVTPGTEIDSAKLGDADTVKRYRDLGALEGGDLIDTVIATGESTDETREKVVEEIKATAEDAKAAEAKEAKAKNR